MMPDITLIFNLTTGQKTKLDRWFTRWNAKLTEPFPTLEDALKDLLVKNVKNFIREENLLKLPQLGDAMRAAPEDVQEAVLGALEPYME